MRKFMINVNGNSYEVEVEEIGGAVSAAPAAPVAAAPAPAAPAAPAAKPAAPAPAAPAAPAAGEKVNCPMPGNILDVRVNVGDEVKEGDILMILEAMKMEIPVVAPKDGTVASINVAVGDAIEAGALLATLN